ncbi:MAG TPA: DUF2141 domain-containing protein [Chryseosolibacter sp.]|nr:DUF2141 domain-containing protein [Chryseosolibacter sp.]
MKKLFYLVLGLVLVTTIDGFTQGSLEVTVQNLKNDQGDIRIGIFQEDKFLKDAVFGKIKKASKGKVVVQFTDLPPGEYALSVIHDENSNQELDSNAVGIPKEGFAFGNNSTGFFGPPSFENAKFLIESGKQTKQVIDMKYL